MSLTLKIKKLKDDAKVPTYAHPGDAGLDLYACEEVRIAPGARAIIGTGVAMEIPEGYVGLVWDKGGISMKGGLKTIGGVVDSGYRGEIMIGIINFSDKEYVFEKGHKVAQMVIQQKEEVTVEEIDELSDTERGDKKFGSSGK